MFGFGIAKLLVLAAIIAVVWYGFKWMRRPRTGGRVAGEAPPGIEDMDKCALCGTFVPAEGAQDCGRDGCPYSS